MKQILLFILAVLSGFITLILIACDYTLAYIVGVIILTWLFIKFCETTN